MDEIDPITVAALEVLKLDTDRVPYHRRELAALVAASRTPLAEWTWEQRDAYQYLWALLAVRRAERKKQEPA